MKVDGFDLITVQGEFITVDLLVWRRYRTPAPGVVEALLDLNPHLAKLHRSSPFLPIGTQVRIPINFDTLKGSPQPKSTIVLWNSNGSA